jgi:septation ring formation regulator EzrA
MEFFFLDFVWTPGLIAGLIGGGVALILLSVILYLTVFSHARLKRQTRELCGKFEREHALLFGQDSQYIKRLETISSMNLVYVQQFTDWNKRFRDVRDVSDASAQAMVNNLKDLLSDRRYKELKATLPSARKTIDEYEEQVDSLSENLKNKFRDEENCRSLSLELKERYRKIKQDFYTHQSDMTILANTFDAVFHKLDTYFDEAEQDVENARYLDGKAILSEKIQPVLDSLNKILPELPNICLLISSVIPDKLASLANHYDEMIQGGYPLHHILLRGEMENMSTQLKSLSLRVQNLDLAGVKKDLDDMQKQIDEYLLGFDKEKKARVVFDNEHDGIYSQETSLENQFINLCHAIPKIRQVYLLGADDQAKIDAIQNTINKAGASKRSLDTYVHSSTKQPYSILVDKMHTLRDQEGDASSSITSFQSYLASLKSDSEAANKALQVYSSRLREAESEVRSINLQAVKDKYLPQIDALYSNLDLLSDDLSHLPIDVKKVNQDRQALEEAGDKLLQSISESVDDMNKAENEIVFANRHRAASSEINAAILQAESLFASGDFKDSYNLASGAIKNLKED